MNIADEVQPVLAESCTQQKTSYQQMPCSKYKFASLHKICELTKSSVN